VAKIPLGARATPREADSATAAIAERLGELNPLPHNCHAEKKKPPSRTLEAHFRQPTTATLVLLPLGRRHACFASSLLRIFELLLGVI